MIPLLTSSLISAPFHHGFTSRAGGVSAPPFHSLNLGSKWGDDRDNVIENRRRLLEATRSQTLYLAAQVHGARVLPVRAGDDPHVVARQQADGVCSDAAGIAVGVYVADCVPVLLADPRTGAFAAVHAGWRGTVAGILEAAVKTMADQYGSRPADLRIAFGPAIAPCCFEVGPEVAAAFAAWPVAIVAEPGRKPHVDLRLVLRQQALAAGVDPAAVDAVDACTKCDPDGRFYSYRRDASRTGQHVGFIARP
ncbi:MAG TPA: peptidoglycan editing factor PgeF [Polyangia bacterium]|nr:peptidoglycan editing factor PgeF [Polyangia bacterium]